MGKAQIPGPALEEVQICFVGFGYGRGSDPGDDFLHLFKKNLDDFVEALFANFRSQLRYSRPVNHADHPDPCAPPAERIGVLSYQVVKRPGVNADHPRQGKARLLVTLSRSGMRSIRFGVKASHIWHALGRQVGTTFNQS